MPIASRSTDYRTVTVFESGRFVALPPTRTLTSPLSTTHLPVVVADESIWK
jgi:hypothetical protein